METYKPFPGQDLSTPENYQNFFGTFWNQIFLEDQFITGLAYINAWALEQLYRDFIFSINRLSTKTIPVFQRELIVPLVMRKSKLSTGPDLLKYGSGAVFGEQPPGGKYEEGKTFEFGGLEKLSLLYYFELPNVKNVGNIIVNRLISPSKILIRDSDFIIVDNVVAFATNPFEDSLLTKRPVYENGQVVDEEMVLWLTECDVESRNLYTQFGFVFSDVEDSSEAYKKIIQSFFNLFPGGPSLSILDSFLATTVGAPIVIEATETVESITPFGSDTIVATDASVYKIPSYATIRDAVKVGAVLKSGFPLTTMTEVMSRDTKTFWWSEQTSIVMPPSYFRADILFGIGFPNKYVPAEYMGEAVPGRDNRGLVRFALNGTEHDVNEFWKYVDAESIKRDEFLGTKLWQHAGLIQTVGDDPVLDDKGEPKADFTQPLSVNPLEFLMEHLSGENMFAIKVDLFNKSTSTQLFQSILYLRESTPAFTSFLVFLNLNFEENYAFQNEITSLELQDTADIVNNRPGSFTPSTKAYWDDPAVNAEAISVDHSPDLVEETYDLDDLQETITIRTNP